MFDRRVSDVMQPRKLLTAPPETSVREACRRMARHKVGAVLVLEEGRLLGIFTERDAVFRVIVRGRSPEATTIAAVMTRDPRTVAPSSPFGAALALMQRHGFRHVPVVDAGRVIGIVSARHALDPDMEDFVAEARRRERFALPARD